MFTSKDDFHCLDRAGAEKITHFMVSEEQSQMQGLNKRLFLGMLFIVSMFTFGLNLSSITQL